MATSASARLFDLNVEKVLDHWGVAEAIREVIANVTPRQEAAEDAEHRHRRLDLREWGHLSCSGKLRLPRLAFAAVSALGDQV
jgi:hypothetical protein